MKIVAFFLLFLIFPPVSYSYPAGNISDSVSTEYLIKLIGKMENDKDKVSALKDISKKLWKSGRQNSALLYLQEGLLLELQLKIYSQVNALQSRLRHKNTPQVSGSEVDNLANLKEELLQVQSRQDTLDFAVKEYNRRTMSFADDLDITRVQQLNKIGQQQVVLSQLATERAKNTKWAIGVGIAFTLLTAIISLQFYRRRQTKHRLEINQLNNKVLRSQLNPHFIFNALNSVKRVIQKDPESAGNYLIKFSTLMRQVLENSQEEKITLEEEIAMLENYMQLESLRLHDGFDYEISIDESVDAGNLMIPPLILQPIIENAVWHGLDPLNRRGKIRLFFTEKADILEATIEDDGAGRNAVAEGNKPIGKKRSFGMQITRERIELLNKKSKAKGWLSHQFFENGSQVKMTIPL